MTETTSVRLVANSNAGCGVAVSNELTIEVYDEITSGTVSGAQTICFGEELRRAIHHKHCWCQWALQLPMVCWGSPSPLATETNQTLEVRATPTKPPLLLRGRHE